MQKDKVISYSVHKCGNCGYERITEKIDIDNDKREKCIFCRGLLTKTVRSELRDVKNEF